MDIGPDSDLIASITPDVMTCFRRSRFFERLDDLLCPKGGSGQSEVCGGDYKISKRILEAAGFDSDDRAVSFASFFLHDSIGTMMVSRMPQRRRWR
jgi:hypothetical protein